MITIKAEEIYNAILDFINILKHFPLMGRKIDSKKRELIMPKYKYKIVYKVGKNKIAIVSIRKEQEKF